MVAVAFACGGDDGGDEDGGTRDAGARDGAPVEDAGPVVGDAEPGSDATTDACTGCGTCELGRPCGTCDLGACVPEDDGTRCVEPPLRLTTVECDPTSRSFPFVFVDPSYSEGDGDGSRERAFDAMEPALAVVNADGSRREAILVGGSPVFATPLRIGDIVGVYGGFGTYPEFTPDPAERPRWEVAVRQENRHPDVNAAVAVSVEGATTAAYLSHLTIATVAGAGEPDGLGSVALRVAGSPALQVVDVEVQAADARDGAAGEDGETGGNGPRDFDGYDNYRPVHLAGCLLTCSALDCGPDDPRMPRYACGAGGGLYGFGEEGIPIRYPWTGIPGTSDDLLVQGGAFEHCDFESAARDGRGGEPGTVGAAGAAAAPSDAWFAAPGGAGEEGTAGTFGAGGGACTHNRFGDPIQPGAAGGAPGRGGLGGGGGQAGGSAVGILVSDSPGFVMLGVSVVSGAGGASGAGGPGGLGGAGGPDGLESLGLVFRYRDASRGGRGGAGGVGGVGAAGGGGNSIALACTTLDELAASGVSLSFGVGGAGSDVCGGRPCPPGAVGAAGQGGAMLGCLPVEGVDACPEDEKDAPGICGCGTPETDRDGDGAPDCVDECPDDPAKRSPGGCGCGLPDADGDMDGVLDCDDGCPADVEKGEPGVCGCGTPDADRDEDTLADCVDGCPLDADKSEPGTCGCGVPDTAGCGGDSDIDPMGAGPCGCFERCSADPVTELRVQSDGYNLLFERWNRFSYDLPRDPWDEWDFEVVQNEARTGHFIFQNRALGVEIAHLAGATFEDVTGCDVASATFDDRLHRVPLDDTRVVLVKLATGEVFKLGNLRTDTWLRMDVAQLRVDCSRGGTVRESGTPYRRRVDLEEGTPEEGVSDFMLEVVDFGARRFRVLPQASAVGGVVSSPEFEFVSSCHARALTLTDRNIDFTAYEDTVILRSDTGATYRLELTGHDFSGAFFQYVMLDGAACR